MYKDFRPGYFDKWTRGNNVVDRNSQAMHQYLGNGDDSDDDLPPMEEDLSPASLHPKKTIYMREGITNKLDVYLSCKFRSFKGREVGWINKNVNTEVIDYITEFRPIVLSLNSTKFFNSELSPIKISPVSIQL